MIRDFLFVQEMYFGILTKRREIAVALQVIFTFFLRKKRIPFSLISIVYRKVVN